MAWAGQIDQGTVRGLGPTAVAMHPEHRTFSHIGKSWAADTAERHFARLPENRGSPRILYINTGVPRCELALGF